MYSRIIKLFEVIMNLSKYKLKNISELDGFINLNPPRFCAFDDRVHSLLDNLPEGDIINVVDVVEEKSYEVFIKLVCSYITEKNMTRKLEDSQVWFIDEEYNIIQRTHSTLPCKHKAIIPQFITT